jgi:hypothetical protein
MTRVVIYLIILKTLIRLVYTAKLTQDKNDLAGLFYCGL